MLGFLVKGNTKMLNIINDCEILGAVRDSREDSVRIRQQGKSKFDSFIDRC